MFINSYRAGWFLKCSFLLKSEVYPVFLLLYLSSTALKLISVNRKVVRKFIFYPLITKGLSFALKFLILISFSSALFLQLERIRNTIHLYGQMHIFIENVRINVKFTKKNCMWTYQYLLSFRKPKISSLKCCRNHPKSLKNNEVMTFSLTLCFHGANMHHRHSKS